MSYKHDKIDKEFVRSIQMMEMLGMDTKGNQNKERRQKEDEMEIERTKILAKNRSIKSMYMRASKNILTNKLSNKSSISTKLCSSNDNDWKMFDI